MISIKILTRCYGCFHKTQFKIIQIVAKWTFNQLYPIYVQNSIRNIETFWFEQIVQSERVVDAPGNRKTSIDAARLSTFLKFEIFNLRPTLQRWEKRWRKDDRTTEKERRRKFDVRNGSEIEEERKRAKEEVDYLRTGRVAKKESNSSFRYDRQDTTSGSSIYLLLYCLIGRYYRQLHTSLSIEPMNFRFRSSSLMSDSTSAI